MPVFSYTAERFSPSWGQSLQGKNDLSCTWSEIIWAAITVGKQNWSNVWRFGSYSRLEAIFRVTMIYASLMEEVETGRILQTDAFLNMDPSEKTAISYFHGLMSTKLLSQRLLSVPWLLHFDLYKNGISHNLHNDLKPDFIGLDINQNWLVLEAKGRSNGLDRKAVTKGKRQTRGLRTIAGTFPNLRAVIQSYFSSNGYFKTIIVDPDEYEKEAVDVNLSLETVISKYYKFILDLIESHHNHTREKEFGGSKYITLDLQEIDITLGINIHLYKMLLQARNVDVDKINAVTILKILTESAYGETSGFFVGYDGIGIQTGKSWSEEAMSVQPSDRMVAF